MNVIVVDQNVQSTKEILGELDSPSVHFKYVSSPEKAIKFLEEDHFDAVMFERDFETMTGIEFLLQVQMMRKPELGYFLFTRPPVEKIIDMVFEIGVHDIILKTMPSIEIQSRLEKGVKDAAFVDHEFRLDNLVFNLAKLTIRLNDRIINVSMIEFKFLYFLIVSYKKNIITEKNKLKKFVWGHIDIPDQTLTTHIYNLKVKFKDWDYEIKTKRNKGYSLSPCEKK